MSSLLVVPRLSPTAYISCLLFGSRCHPVETDTTANGHLYILFIRIIANMSALHLQATLFFFSAFSILLPVQLSIGLQRKTYGFLIAITLGHVLEILAYVARILLHNGQERFAVMYFLPITIAPTLFSTAIYLCLPRIIETYGAHLCPISTRAYHTTLVLADASALVLQAIGGVIAGIDTMSKLDVGLRIVQVGLAAHIVTMAAFVFPTLIFAFNAYKRSTEWAKQFEDLRCSKTFKAFLVGLSSATLSVLIRTCYRIAEPGASFNGDNESAFLVLDGGMILIACIFLTVLHPGVVFRHSSAKANISTVHWQELKA
ncbi:RTA1 like protein-domain-containing protein [Lophiotrema nucula]|uniref:RTA1 like protein-domain-containing protein n=1 Tax=Lophiotrema nucula TaxID=690887 RepID=A0A6A5ZRY3_9PLEO|nr:RTA1 like protein-domain-containing protein [Lophiotrema nucula]